MDAPIHGRPEHRNLIELPRFEENIVRNDLFLRENGDFVQVNLRDRNVESYTGEDRALLNQGLAYLQDLKLVFQTLGPLGFGLRSAANAPKQGKRRGNPACLTDNGERNGEIQFGLLTALVEEGNYEAHRGAIEGELSQQDNFKFQMFLIFNYGERLNLVTPNSNGRVTRLRKRGLSMKEIELILFVVEFQPGFQEQLPEVMQYLESSHWSDIFNFVAEYKRTHQNVVEALHPYLRRFVTNTFITAFQNFFDYDLTNLPGIILDPETIIQPNAS